MTDQNQDNQKPQQEGEQQPYMPPQPQEAHVEQPQEAQTQQPQQATPTPEPVQQQQQPQPQQPQPQPVYQQQQPTQGQTIYQGQPNYGQQQGGYTQQGNLGGVPPQDMPDTYMTLSVIATVIGWLTCCASSCIGGIVGIVAIVFSSQVTSKYAMGDMRGAKSSSETAKILAIVSFVITGLSFLGSILYAIYYMKLFSGGDFSEIMEVYKDALDQAR